MTTMSFDSFLKNPGAVVKNASVGEHSKVTMGDGTACVMIDECEWAMLTQALSICMEHPEWTIKKS